MYSANLYFRFATANLFPPFTNVFDSSFVSSTPKLREDGLFSVVGASLISLALILRLGYHLAFTNFAVNSLESIALPEASR